VQKFKYYLKKKKYIFLFLGVLILFGFVVGLILGITNIDILKENVFYYIEHIPSQSYNYLFIHFFFLVISFITSFFGIGIPILCTILFYEGLTFGFLMGIFSLTCGIGGFFFSIVFTIVTKLFYILFLFFFFLKCLEIARKMIGKYIYKTPVPSILISLSKASILFILFIFFNDLLVLFFGSKIITIFGFLIL